MNDVHEATAPDGYKLQRIWNKPEMGVDTTWDANSARDFTEKSGKKRGNLNDLWEKSAELSQIREKQQGVDPIAITSNEEYKKLHRGIEKPEFRKKKLKEQMKNNSMFELDI